MTVLRSKTVRILGDGPAYSSLTGSVSFWILLALSFVPRFPLSQAMGFRVLKIMGVSLVLAILSLRLRSKLWLVALPVALAMFFFTKYLMGS